MAYSNCGETTGVSAENRLGKGSARRSICRILRPSPSRHRDDVEESGRETARDAKQARRVPSLHSHFASLYLSKWPQGHPPLIKLAVFLLVDLRYLSILPWPPPLPLRMPSPLFRCAPINLSFVGLLRTTHLALSFVSPWERPRDYCFTLDPPASLTIPPPFRPRSKNNHTPARLRESLHDSHRCVRTTSRLLLFHKICIGNTCNVPHLGMICRYCYCTQHRGKSFLFSGLAFA